MLTFALDQDCLTGSLGQDIDRIRRSKITIRKGD